MRFSFLLFTFFILGATLSAQSFLLQPGQTSKTLPLRYSGEGASQFGAGYIYSKNGKFDVGINADFITRIDVFNFSPFYNYYFYNDVDKEGLALSGGLRYNLLLDQNGNTAHLGNGILSAFYRIPTEKVTIVPEFQFVYSRDLENDISDTGYSVAANFAFHTTKGYITFIPRYTFNDLDGIFSIGLNFQWLSTPSGE